MSKRRQYDALLRWIAPHEKAALAKVRAALTSLDVGSVAQLTQLLRAGKYEAALDYAVSRATAAPSTAAWAEVITALQQTHVQAASAMTSGALIVPELGTVRVGFRAFDPNVAQYLDRYGLDLVSTVNRETREGLRTVLTDGLRRGKGPSSIARDMRQLIGLTPRQAQAVLNYRDELTTGRVREALGRQLRDRRFDPTIRRAELPPERVDRAVQRYKDRYLLHRSENIARTESMRALAQGRRLAFDQARGAGVIPGTLVMRRKWYVAPDEGVCPVCRGIAELNRNGVGMDEPFRLPEGGTVLDPPAHMLCRCTTFPEVVSVG